MARYELNELDGGWLDTTQPCGPDGGMRAAEDGQEELFACAEEYEVVAYMSTLESSHAELLEAAQGLVRMPSMHDDKQTVSVARHVQKLQEAIKSATEAKP